MSAISNAAWVSYSFAAFDRSATDDSARLASAAFAVYLQEPISITTVVCGTTSAGLNLKSLILPRFGLAFHQHQLPGRGLCEEDPCRPAASPTGGL